MDLEISRPETQNLCQKNFGMEEVGLIGVATW